MGHFDSRTEGGAQKGTEPGPNEVRPTLRAYLSSLSVVCQGPQLGHSRHLASRWTHDLQDSETSTSNQN